MNGFRDEDGPTVAFSSDGRAGTPEFGPTTEPHRDPAELLHVELVTDEWVRYDVETTARGNLALDLIGDLDNADLVVTVDGEPTEPKQPDLGAFRSGRLLNPGSHSICIRVMNGCIRLRALDVATLSAR
jgi:hypothetical protein